MKRFNPQKKFTNKLNVKIYFFALSLLGFACKSEEPHSKSAAQAATASKSLNVFCGSANKPAMEDIARLFQKKTGVQVNMTFGGSGTLLSQIALAKKGDIYIPGSPDYILIAHKKNLLVKKSERIVAYLVPAIITPAGNPAKIHSLADLTKPKIRLGIGNPETVCLGLYAIELLQKNKLLAQVVKNVVTFGASCSKTANLAAMNKVDAILGWRVFHYWNPKRMAFVPIAQDSIPRISYIPIAIPIYAKDQNLSRQFIDFVLSPTGQKAYLKFGYLTEEKQARAFAPHAKIGGEYHLPPEYFEIIKSRPKQK